VGADRDCLHGLFLGLDVSDGRDEHIDRGFWVGVGGANSTISLVSFLVVM
jgi:hypothetical protein